MVNWEPQHETARVNYRDWWAPEKEHPPLLPSFLAAVFCIELAVICPCSIAIASFSSATHKLPIATTCCTTA